MNEIPYERVKIARDNGRPTGTDYIKNIFKNFIEFHGDRCYADDKAIVGGIARLNGRKEATGTLALRIRRATEKLSAL